MIHAIRAHHERSTNRQSDANGTHKRHAHSKRGLRIVSSARVAEACAKIPLEKVKDEAHKVESSRSKARCKRGAKGQQREGSPARLPSTTELMPTASPI